MGCIRRGIGFGVLAAAVSIVFVCFWSVGCKRKPAVSGPAVPLESVITNRANDAAYLDTLKKNRADQTKIAAQRAEVSRKMDACRERVRSSLPAEAEEAAINAALEKDQEWTELVKQTGELAQRDQQVLSAAREAVRARLQEEARAVKAVAEGKAKAVDRIVPRGEAGSTTGSDKK